MLIAGLQVLCARMLASTRRAPEMTVECSVLMRSIKSLCVQLSSTASRARRCCVSVGSAKGATATPSAQAVAGGSPLRCWGGRAPSAGLRRSCLMMLSSCQVVEDACTSQFDIRDSRLESAIRWQSSRSDARARDPRAEPVIRGQSPRSDAKAEIRGQSTRSMPRLRSEARA